MKSEWADFSKYHSGDMLTRLTRDIGIMTDMLMSVIPNIASFAVKFIAAFITLYFYEPILALSAFTLGPAAILISRIFSHRIKKLHTRMQETEGAYRSLINESVQNLLIIKSFRLEDRNSKRMGSIQDGMVNLAFKKSRISSAANGVLNLGYWAGYFLALGWGILKLSAGAASFGPLRPSFHWLDKSRVPS
jgi:ABC-type multidrug transport system fused ATPase/permease subunit